MKFTAMSPQIGITQILSVTLIIAAYLLGVFMTKVQYLEKNGNSVVAAAQTPSAVVPNQPAAPAAKQNVTVGHLPIKGNDDAKVTIIEFEDFRCPFCERFTTDTESQIIKEYVDTGKAKLAFRHYAFLGDASVVAANASECANEQGKFWDMHEYLYKNQPPESDTSMYTTDKLTEIAGNLGMNAGQFQSCLSSKKYDSDVSADMKDGQGAGVTGTPTIFINGIPIVGAQPYSSFKAAIDAELAKS